jgi:putative PIN family toxin of toxin-antitoxin system
MKVVIDTNVFLVSISSNSKLHWIFEHLMNQTYTLCLTTDIVLEYEEIIGQQMGFAASQSALGVLENLTNVEWITTYYQFYLLQDKDDNKFVDCAVAANADYLITHDKDFTVLKTIEFPKIEIIDTNEFYKILYPQN